MQCSAKNTREDWCRVYLYILGLRGTYQGLTATVLKQGSNQAIRFFVMTSLRNWYKGLHIPAFSNGFNQGFDS